MRVSGFGGLLARWTLRELYLWRPRRGDCRRQGRITASVDDARQRWCIGHEDAANRGQLTPREVGGRQLVGSAQVLTLFDHIHIKSEVIICCRVGLVEGHQILQKPGTLTKLKYLERTMGTQTDDLESFGDEGLREGEVAGVECLSRCCRSRRALVG